MATKLIESLRALLGWRFVSDLSPLNCFWKLCSPTEQSSAKVLRKLRGDYAGRTLVKYVTVFNFVSHFHAIAVDKETTEYLRIVLDSESCCYGGLLQGFLNSPFLALVVVQKSLGLMYNTPSIGQG